MDFKKATELFADPDFDGEPVEIYNPGEGGTGSTKDFEGENGKEKYYVDDVEVGVVTERTQYYGPDGKLITESLKDYTRKTVLKDFESLDSFLKHWNEAEKKEAILSELEERGILFDALSEEVGKGFDPFDLICHVAFDRPPLSRKERAEKVKKSDYFSKYGKQVQDVLSSLLDKYADDGIENLENMSVLKVQPFDRIGTPLEIVKLFGGKNSYLSAVRGLESQLYTLEA
jgi:type I restriction enzyme R subunit